MNDTELDDMLNQWEAPEVPARLRDSIVLPRPPKRRIAWPSWHLSKGLLAGVAIGGVMCLFGVAAAFPQALSPTPRFNLLSKFVVYRSDGTSTIQELRASTAQQGREIILDQNFPDSLFMTVHARFFGAVHRLLGLEHPGPPTMASDCSSPDNSAVAHEKLLGYQTTKLLFKPGETGGRYIEWRSPQLDCIIMKSTWEKAENGEFKLTEERLPMVVRINRTQ